MIRQALIIALLSIVGLFHNDSSADDHPAKQIIRVAIFDDAGVTKTGIPQVEHCLPTVKGFDVKRISAKQIRDGELKDFDVLIHPGGSGSGQAKTLGEKGSEAEKRFVNEGGGFIGICAGAYFASAEYKWSLHLLNAHVVDGAHWARGEGNVQLRISPAGQTALGTAKDICTIHFENGPLLGPVKAGRNAGFESLATFETEIATNGAPPGVMKGATAIARGKFGKGRVVCFSPHPEKTPGHEAFLQSAVSWAVRAASDEHQLHESKPQSGDRQ